MKILIVLTASVAEGKREQRSHSTAAPPPTRSPTKQATQRQHLNRVQRPNWVPLLSGFPNPFPLQSLSLVIFADTRVKVGVEKFLV